MERPTEHSGPARTLVFREARPEDVPRIVEIIACAQARMKARGSDQWQHGYPARGDIERDIAAGVGRVLCSPERGIAAYGAVIFTGEAAYRSLRGHWLSDEEYVVVHRLAVAEEALGRGIATEFMRRTAQLARERGVKSFRVDTNFDNTPMLRVLAALGFARCGEIDYAGDPRQAFEKLL